MENKIKIKISDVLDLLNNGKSRKEIKQYYNLSDYDIKELFKHKDLKGKRTKRKVGFVIVEEDNNNNEKQLNLISDKSLEDYNKEKEEKWKEYITNENKRCSI